MTEEKQSQTERESEEEFEHEWVFYWDERQRKGIDGKTFNQSTKKLGDFRTVQGFWKYWNNIDMNKLPPNSNLRLFKKGIEPAWEDPANAKGGKWVITVPNKETTNYWLKLVLSLIGEQFRNSADLCGAVLAIRGQGFNSIQLWNRDSHNTQIIQETQIEIQNIINPTNESNIAYLPHGFSTYSPKPTSRNPKTKQKTRNSSLSTEAPFESPFIDLIPRDSSPSLPLLESIPRSPSHSSLTRRETTIVSKHRKSLSHSSSSRVPQEVGKTGSHSPRHRGRKLFYSQSKKTSSLRNSATIFRKSSSGMLQKKDDVGDLKDYMSHSYVFYVFLLSFVLLLFCSIFFSQSLFDLVLE
eukprot:TRINITY_DN7922_c0_g1_i1.p1 TRINITY_DN7922_c0_g1~~TRINITY_DN7922_c0_g1_i1.p1  ORF type:complete len:389 (-),score=73.31 TRINITY_DN7922_c0_g1_i1:52-1113(-)